MQGYSDLVCLHKVIRNILTTMCTTLVKRHLPCEENMNIFDFGLYHIE